MKRFHHRPYGKALIAAAAVALLAGCSGSEPKPTAGLFHDYLNAYQLRAPELNYLDQGQALREGDRALFERLSEVLLTRPEVVTPLGPATTPNPQLVDWVKQQAEADNSVARLHLGSLYWLQADWQQAQYWLGQVENDAFAQYLLALLFDDQRNPQQDAQQSRQWLQKSADQGFSAARHLLAWRYVKGEQVPQNWRSARLIYQALAAEGDAVAQAQLGLLQMFGVGGERNTAAAVKQLQPVADQPAVAYLLALSYRYGVGVAKDATKAQQHLNTALAANFAPAANLQGQWLAVEEGDDADDALDWFRAAITEKSVQPQFNLGLSYWRGQYTYQDIARARQWLTPIEDRSLAARKLLAFLATLDLPFGDREALRLSEKGIDQGDRWSFYLRGILLIRSETLPTDLVESYALLNVASALGYKPATEVRDTVLSQLSHAQRKAGQLQAQQMFNRLQATERTATAGEQ